MTVLRYAITVLNVPACIECQALIRMDGAARRPAGFSGSSAFMEFAFSIARGGWEPTACTGHLISASGRGRLVSIAIEPRNHVRAINYLVAGEWLHAGRLAAAVHLPLARSSFSSPRRAI